jgi:hypothetical protein
VAKKKKRDEVVMIPYEKLPDSIKSMYTPDSWREAMIEQDRIEKEQWKRAMTKPPDWVEPSITIEEALADPFTSGLADLMTRHEIKVLTRSQYFAMEYGHRVPRPWTAELEASLPLQLQDRYMTIPKGLGRKKLEADEV